MQTFIQLGLTTLQIGAVYILFSLGLTLIFGVMRIVNFVHGHIFAVSALMVATLVPVMAGAGMSPLPAYLLAALAGIVSASALGSVIYLFGFRYFQRDLVGSFILSIGLINLLITRSLVRDEGGRAHVLTRSERRALARARKKEARA